MLRDGIISTCRETGRMPVASRTRARCWRFCRRSLVVLWRWRHERTTPGIGRLGRLGLCEGPPKRRRSASRPTMHFVAVKSEESRRGCAVRGPRPSGAPAHAINAGPFGGVRCDCAEGSGSCAPSGAGDRGIADEPAGEGARAGPAAGADCRPRPEDRQEKELRAAAREDEDAAMTVPGVGPITALQAFAPPLETFRRGRDFSAWLGLVPRQHTTAGKPRLGKLSKMGQRDLRRLLVVGAMSVPRSAMASCPTRGWRRCWRATRMLVAVALANRMRILWALATRKETYRAPATASRREQVRGRLDAGGLSKG